MKPSRFMDLRLDKVDALNDLGSIQTDDYVSAIEKKKKNGESETSGDAGGLFGAVTAEMFFRADGGARAGVVGIIHPSDGHPMQEHCPDFN